MNQLSSNLYEVQNEDDFCYETLWTNHNLNNKFVIRWGGVEQTYYYDRPLHLVIEANDLYEEGSVCLTEDFKVLSVSSGVVGEEM